jgi:hypothetical protein
MDGWCSSQPMLGVFPMNILERFDYTYWWAATMGFATGGVFIGYIHQYPIWVLVFCGVALWLFRSMHRNHRHLIESEMRGREVDAE